MSREYVDEIKKLIKKETSGLGNSGRLTSEFVAGTFESISKKIRIVEALVWEYTPVDDETLRQFFETARREYLSVSPVKIEPSNSLTKRGFQTWLTDERNREIKWRYLDRYIHYLERIGRSELVVQETMRSSRDIVEKLGDPESVSGFFVKGLVVGEVQSGKTANFNAVMNRAIDCGYKLIIVFSGIMEDLRGQTQDRVENDVVGWGSIDQNGRKWDQTGRKGVGLGEHFGMQGDTDVQLIESITSCRTDFSGAIPRGGAALNSPKILVCKKNVSVLKNIINWLGDLLDSETDSHSIPLLILDDEADNASLNNEGAKGREYASKVNGHIRAILAMFEKKSYLGYTASPFANVLQDRNDAAENRWPVKSANGERTFPQVNNLFPDDFIVLLESPTNYVGAKQIFETIADVPKLPALAVAGDHVSEFPSRLLRIDGSPVENFPTTTSWDENVGEFGVYQGFTKHSDYRRETRASKRDDDFPGKLPHSLREAVICFILSIAVRESRKNAQSGSNLFEPHNTMLVHISRFTTWQNKTRDLISECVSEIKSRLENEKPDQVGSIYLEFEDIWNRYFKDSVANIRDYLRDGYEDPFMVPIIFEVLRKFLPASVGGIDVLAINSATGDKLEYSGTPRRIIAVGGNRLSRGFTVRGLTINYFVRATNYSDTLLQMGRWFGYRPGYLDCCKIFTTSNSIEKFNATTRCIEELETEFKKMDDQGKSPSNFEVRVRKHPGVLEITRPSILKNATTVNWSYEDQLVMTTKFDITRQNVETVWNSFRDHTASLLSAPPGRQMNFLKAEVTGHEFIEFLRRPNNFDPTTLEDMIRFIELCQEDGKLVDWTIALKLNGQSKRTIRPEFSRLPCETGLVVRNAPSTEHSRDQFLSGKVFRASGKSANIVSSNLDLAITLEAHEIEAAEREFLRQRRNSLEKRRLSEEEIEKQLPKTIPERVYRERIPQTRGILIIYLFDSYHSFVPKHDPDGKFEKFVKEGGYNLDIPLVGYAIGFPPIEGAPGGQYAKGDYDLEDEGDDEDVSYDDMSLPDDEITGT
jgi:hypothetical protein